MTQGPKIEIEKRKPTRPEQSVILLAKIKNGSEEKPAIRCYMGEKGWCYTVGETEDGKFDPVIPEVRSSKPPWQQATKLWKKLKPGLEELGINDNAQGVLSGMALTVDKKGGSKIFNQNTPDETKGGIFKEEDISEEKLEEAEKIIEEGRAIPKILDLYEEVHVGDHVRKILLFCSAVAKRLTNKAINDHAVGTSGKGKSHLMRITANGIPNEYALIRDSISSKYLYYLTRDYGSDCLDGKVVYYDDVTLNEEKEAVIKTITDPGPTDEATHGTVEDQKRIDLKIEGLPTVWISSVDTFSSDQMRNRFFIDHPDESENLDQEVADKQKEFGRRGILEPEREVNFELAKAIYKKIIAKDNGENVLIPFDYEWKYTSDRRLQPLFLRLLYTITKINRAKRQKIGDYILADFEDFYLAKLVLNTFLLATAENMTQKMKKVWEALPNSRENALSRGEIAEESGLGYGTIRYNLESDGKLKDMGFANAVKKDGEWKYWKTEKSVVNSCAGITQPCLSFEGLKKEAEKSVSVVEITQNAIRKGIPKYTARLKLSAEGYTPFHIFSEVSQRMNLSPEDALEHIDAESGCETLTQLFTTIENDLERSQEKLMKELYEFYLEEFGKNSTPKPKNFIDAAKDRFPYENRERLEEAAEKLEEDHEEVIFMEDIGDF